MVWLTEEPALPVYPYCEIIETARDGRRYDLVVVYGDDLRTVQSFSALADARRRAEEWRRIWSPPVASGPSGAARA
jgi:hypothetical protein